MKDLKQIEQYTSYPKYKDSGIEWLGKIPDHWEKVKTKTIFKLVNGGTPKSDNEDFWDEEGIVWITPEDLSSHGIEIDNSKRKISKEGLLNSSATLTKENSIVISTRAPIGNIKICTVPYTTNQGCKSLESISNLNIRYFYYLFYCSKDYLQSLGKGTTFLEVSNYSLKNMELIVPPIDEQNQIARFLDKKTSEIDSLIADKEKLIEHLQEYRQAIITEAVTKGLSPETTKMKDSGIEWLGEVPEQWDIKPLFAYMKKKQLKNVNNIEQNVLSLSYGKIVRRDVESNFGLLPESFETYQIVEPGNIILRLTDLQNDKRSLRVGLVKERGIITSAYLCLQITTEELNSEYAYYLLHTYDLKKVFYNLGSGVRQSLKYDELKRMPLLIPPLKEQEKIVNYLSTKTEQLDALVNDLIKQIGSIKKYKESLINEVATGKIDVRGFRKGE